MNAAMTAGIASSVMFLVSHLPMVVRAARTRDLSSYSRGNLVLVNAGNALYTLYVASLPIGPIWLLHSVYTGVSAFMLLAHVCWAPVRLDDGRTPAAAAGIEPQTDSLVVAHVWHTNPEDDGKPRHASATNAQVRA